MILALLFYGMDNATFEKAVCDYQDGVLDKDGIFPHFHQAAKEVVKYYQVKRRLPVDTDDAIQECVMMCYEKAHRYDRTKGVAFNFFTTCMSGILCQHIGRSKSYKELKERYRKHLDDRSQDEI